MDESKKTPTGESKRGRKKVAAGDLTAQDQRLIKASTEIITTPPTGEDNE